MNKNLNMSSKLHLTCPCFISSSNGPKILHLTYKKLVLKVSLPIHSFDFRHVLTGETEHENSELRMWAASEWSTFLGVPGLSREGSLQQPYTYEY